MSYPARKMADYRLGFLISPVRGHYLSQSDPLYFVYSEDVYGFRRVAALECGAVHYRRIAEADSRSFSRGEERGGFPRD